MTPSCGRSDSSINKAGEGKVGCGCGADAEGTVLMLKGRCTDAVLVNDVVNGERGT